MEKFIIQGGIPLHGEMTPSGNKNAALPLVAAALLSEEAVTLHNVPDIRDVRAMLALLESVGAEVERLGPNQVRIQAKDVRPANLDPEACRGIRTSMLLAGPMSARCGELVLPPPGGDVGGDELVQERRFAHSGLSDDA